MKIGEVVRKKVVIAALFGASLLSKDAAGLPFNDDMVDVQKRTGVIMRQKAPGTVAVGLTSYYIAKKADAEALVNPLKGDPNSALNGRRLFTVNCSPCHGDIGKKPYAPGPVAAKMPAAPPDITVDMYKGRTDGFFYGTIHFGGMILMPPLGWKLSPAEHWDIINYIRQAQGIK